jgi:outer membrane protein insertion porin family
LNASVSQYVREQAGTAITSLFSQSVTYDRRNNAIDPTSGFFVTLGTDMAGFGGTERYVKGTAGTAFYAQPATGWIFSAALSGTYIVGLGRDLKIYQRSQLGGYDLRGFKDFGASPRDAVTLDALGGDWMAVATMELRVPLGIPKEAGIKTKLFNDWGVIGPPKDLKDRGTVAVLDSRAIRGAAGIGVEWTSPVGVISLDYSPFIFNAQSFDRTSHFRINFGNRFQ